MTNARLKGENELRWLAVQFQKARDIPNQWRPGAGLCRVQCHNGGLRGRVVSAAGKAK